VKRREFLKSLGVVLGWGVPAGFGLAAEESSSGSLDDLLLLKKRFCAALVEEAPAPREEILKIARGLDGEGRWADVDYENRSRSSWKTFEHLRRLWEIVRARSTPGSSLFENRELSRAISRGLDFWLARDFRNPNWWWNRIGVPRALSRILLLAERDLTGAQRSAGIEILRRGRLGMTGQNLVWVADVTIARGCLQQDAALVSRALDAVEKTISTDFSEGIQKDYSFYQHGRCLYSGGYGLGFSVDCARLALLGTGTGFGFSREKIDLLSAYILDGQQWMMRRHIFDYGAVGREISRKGKTGEALAGACRHMARLNTPRKAEFEAFHRRILGVSDPGDPVFSGNRHFWKADFMAHHRPGFYISARMCSNRIDNTDDPCNSEGLLSHHIADGATFIFQRGTEYFDVFGLWDWRKIPGATIEQKPLQGSPRHGGTASFAGGVSDGERGVAAMDFRAGKLSAQKAWFFTGNGVVCLGAGITSESERPVFTTINQCRLVGDVMVSAGGREFSAAPGRTALSDVNWVLHDGIGYCFLHPRKVLLEHGPRRGSWRNINRRYPDEESILDLFTLWMDHGARPRDASYAYAVAPGVHLDSLKIRARELTGTVLANNRSLQAVRSGEYAGFAFHEAGAAAVGVAYTIGVSHPCLVLVKETEGSLQIAAANPKNEPLDLQIEINLQLQGESARWLPGRGITRIQFSLPGGSEGGRSVVKRFISRRPESSPSSGRPASGRKASR